MALLCLEYKVVTVPYFLDDMQTYELSVLMDNINVAVKNDWIIAREIMWSNLAPWSKKKLKPSDIMHLPYDNKDNKPHKVEITKELVKQMQDSAQQRQAQLIAAGIL